MAIRGWPSADQMLHRVRGALAVGHRDDVDVGQMDRAVEDDQRHAGLQELAEAALVVLRGDREQPGHAFGAERVEVDALAVGRAVGVGQQQRVAELGDLVVDAPDDGGEEQVLDVGNQHADGGALARAQVSGRAVGLVVQLMGGAAHALFQVGAHASGPRQDARDRGGRHASQRGHLTNRRRALGVTGPGGGSRLVLVVHGWANPRRSRRARSILSCYRNDFASQTISRRSCFTLFLAG